MVIVLEIAGLLLAGFVVWVLYQAANARPDDSGLRWTARIGLTAWIGFMALWVISQDGVGEDPLRTLGNVLIVLIILAVVMGYRRILGRLKDRAGR
ncbi:MAG: hypothetical protein AAF557_06775 [Pseudomonadota bacterium]